MQAMLEEIQNKAQQFEATARANDEERGHAIASLQRELQDARAVVETQKTAMDSKKHECANLAKRCDAMHLKLQTAVQEGEHLKQDRNVLQSTKQELQQEVWYTLEYSQFTGAPLNRRLCIHEIQVKELQALLTTSEAKAIETKRFDEETRKKFLAQIAEHQTRNQEFESRLKLAQDQVEAAKAEAQEQSQVSRRCTQLRDKSNISEVLTSTTFSRLQVNGRESMSK